MPTRNNEDSEEEHVYFEVASVDYDAVADSPTFCVSCDSINEELGEMESECYNNEHHPLSCAESRQKRVQMENYILRETVETERLVRCNLKGKIR